MPLTKTFKSREIYLTKESISLIKLLAEAIREQNANSAFFVTLDESAEIGTTCSLPEISFRQDGLADRLYETFQMKVCGALMSVGLGPKDTDGRFESHYCVAWEILRRLVALMMSAEFDGMQWFDVYNNFANKIGHSGLLLTPSRLVFFGREPSEFNQLLSNSILNQELKQEVERINLFTKDPKALSPEESERVKGYLQTSVQSITDILDQSSQHNTNCSM